MPGKSVEQHRGWELAFALLLSISDFVFMFLHASLQHEMSLWIGLMYCSLKCKTRIQQEEKERNQSISQRQETSEWGGRLHEQQTQI